jgi:hypothetical protein
MPDTTSTPPPAASRELEFKITAEELERRTKAQLELGDAEQLTKIIEDLTREAKEAQERAEKLFEQMNQISNANLPQPQPKTITDLSTIEEVREVITQEINRLSCIKPTALITEQLKGYQNYMAHAAQIFKPATKYSSDHVTAQILTHTGGIQLWQFYHADTPDKKTTATTAILNTCKAMEKQNCCQRIKQYLLGAVGVAIVLGSIAALVVSFGTLAPAATALSAVGVAISVEALGTLYGVAAVGVGLGALKFRSAFKAGMFGTKPETHLLGAEMRKDVEACSKVM